MATKAPAKKLATLTKQVELAAALRQRIAAHDIAGKPDKEALAELEGQIRNAMLDAGTEAIKTDAGTYSIKRMSAPKVMDWAALNKYVVAKKATDLYQARLHAGAYNERIAAGEKIPGVEIVEVTSVAWRAAS